MAPSLSKLAEQKHSIMGIAGLSAAIWIIAYGKFSANNKKKYVHNKI